MTVHDPGSQHPTEHHEEKWPGLAAFTEEQQRFFYGRASELDELHRRVEREPLCVLFGQSGLGKTSLLQAGLFPRLRAIGYLPVSVRLDYASDAPPPEDQLRRALDQALAQHGIQPAARPRVDETLWEYFHRVEGQAAGPDGRAVVAVLVLDQFEEVFTLGQSRVPGRVEELIEVLAGLIENRVPAAVERRLEETPELVESLAFDREDHRVLLSLREDYLPHLQDLRRHLPSVMQNAMRLTRLDAPQALEAVLGPGGDLVTPAVARRIVAFVAAAGQSPEVSRDGGMTGVEVEPALLSLVCRELDNRRLAARLPAITEDLLAGSSEDILRDFYDRCLADQPVAVRAFVEDELLSQGVEALGGKVFRESISLERASRLLSTRGVPADALQTLVERRLLHVEERLGVSRVELTHDVLIEVVRRSRSERLQREAAGQAERDAEEARARLWRGRRRAALVAGGLAVLAAVAIVIAATTSRANRRLEALADSLRTQTSAAVSARTAADSNAAQAERNADSAAAARQRAQQREAEAVALRNESEAMHREADTLTRIYSAYTLSAVDALSDSSFQRPETAGLYDAFLGISDDYVGRMRSVSERSVEPVKLQTRIKTVRAMRERQAAPQATGGDRAAAERRATTTAKEAVDLASALLRRSNAPDTRDLAAAVFYEGGSVLQEFGDARDALNAAEKGIEAVEAGDVVHERRALERLGRLHRLRGFALFQLGDSAGAERAQDSGVVIARRNVALRDTSVARNLLSAALDAYGNILRSRGKYAAALAAFREQLRIDEALAAADTSVAAQRNVAWSWGKMGLGYENVDSMQAAEAAHLRRIELRRRIAERTGSQDDQSDLSVAREVLSGFYDRWGNSLLGRGDTTGARRLYRQEEEIDRALLAERETVGRAANLAFSLRKVERTLQSPDSARSRRAVLRELLRLRWGIVALKDSSQYRRDVVDAAGDLVAVVDDPADPPGSIAALRFAIAILDSVRARDPRDPLVARAAAIHHGRLGRHLFAMDSFPAAAAAYQARTNLQRDLRARGDSATTLEDLTGALGGLSFYLLFAGRPAASLAASDEALAAGPSETWLNTNRAHALLLLGRDAEAESVYRRYVGQVIEDPNRTWEIVVREDLCALVRKNAMTAAQADRVDGWLGSSGSANGWRAGCEGVDD
ncbi:MAG TPA: ATP-binding protein [Gemmatimonadales bacterium]